MANSLKFGTSGLRGLASDLRGAEARRYTTAFLRHVRNLGQLGGGKVFVGRDFRPSSPAIAGDCAAAIRAFGLEPVDCGTIATPALAYHAMMAGCGAIMVTGSHIPADRNGLKFYVPGGEISKADEAGILAELADDPGAGNAFMSDEAGTAAERYFGRCAALLPAGTLNGLRIGVFEHSTVARDVLKRVMQHAGATLVGLGRTDSFVAVDTEAFGDAVFAPLAGWIASERLDAIVSADGDGDRPLLMDGKGAFVRGDVLGLLAARYLDAKTVVTPVTSNSAIERTGFFAAVVRTKVGSPFVVAAMEQYDQAVVGFEANGGTFVGNGVSIGGQALAPCRRVTLSCPCFVRLALRCVRAGGWTRSWLRCRCSMPWLIGSRMFRLKGAARFSSGWNRTRAMPSSSSRRRALRGCRASMGCSSASGPATWCISERRAMRPSCAATSRAERRKSPKACWTGRCRRQPGPSPESLGPLEAAPVDYFAVASKVTLPISAVGSFSAAMKSARLRPGASLAVMSMVRLLALPLTNWLMAPPTFWASAAPAQEPHDGAFGETRKYRPHGRRIGTLVGPDALEDDVGQAGIGHVELEIGDHDAHGRGHHVVFVDAEQGLRRIGQGAGQLDGGQVCPGNRNLVDGDLVFGLVPGCIDGEAGIDRGDAEFGELLELLVIGVGRQLGHDIGSRGFGVGRNAVEGSRTASDRSYRRCRRCAGLRPWYRARRH